MFGGLGAAASLIFLIFALVLFVLAVFMPWFVYRIGQEVKETNRLLRKMVTSLDPEGAAKEAAVAAQRAKTPAIYR